MASLLRPWKVYYVDAAGARVKVGTPGARKIQERVKCWYGQYRTAAGKWVRVRLTENKRAAETMLADLVRRADLERAGLAAPVVPVLDLSWETLREEWERALRVEGVTAESLIIYRRWLDRFTRESGAGSLRAVTPDLVNRWIESLLASISPVTQRYGLRHLRRFGRWLVEVKGLRENPFGATRLKQAQQSERTYKRVSIPLETVDALVRHLETRGGPVRRRLSAASRALLYRVAAQSGYRAAELRWVDGGSLVDGGIRLPADRTKNRREAWQPLPSGTFRDLVEVAARTSGPLWPGGWSIHAAQMIQADLVAAGLPTASPAGGIYDFHSLRHTYVTTLGRSGIGLKEAQTLSRHEDPRLTIGTYSHTEAARLRAAIDAIFPESGSTRIAQGKHTTSEGIGGDRRDRGESVLPDPGRNYLQEDGFQ